MIQKMKNVLYQFSKKEHIKKYKLLKHLFQNNSNFL